MIITPPDDVQRFLAKVLSFYPHELEDFDDLSQIDDTILSIYVKELRNAHPKLDTSLLEEYVKKEIYSWEDYPELPNRIPLQQYMNEMQRDHFAGLSNPVPFYDAPHFDIYDRVRLNTRNRRRDHFRNDDPIYDLGFNERYITEAEAIANDRRDLESTNPSYLERLMRATRPDFPFPTPNAKPTIHVKSRPPKLPGAFPKKMTGGKRKSHSKRPKSKKSKTKTKSNSKKSKKR